MKTKLTLLAVALVVSFSSTSASANPWKGLPPAFTAPETAAAAEKAKPYPLAKCLVSGNDLDSMGGPITKVYNGQEIKFCCKPCIKKFEANQAKYLAKLK